MKKVVSYALLGALLSLPGALFAGQKDDSALFVVLSKEASIQATQTGYELTLKGINPSVTYFSNRPARISGQISTAKFVDQWKSGEFTKSAPNAAIEAVSFKKASDSEHARQSYTVVLDKATFVSANEVRFAIKALPGNKTALPKIGRSEYVALFVDDVCLWCIIH